LQGIWKAEGISYGKDRKILDAAAVAHQTRCYTLEYIENLRKQPKEKVLLYQTEAKVTSSVTMLTITHLTIGLVVVAVLGTNLLLHSCYKLDVYWYFSYNHQIYMLKTHRLEEQCAI
jgi:CRISPR/Cas system CMR subunit Cmr6 (Cas7 group RAMP superfamily)